MPKMNHKCLSRSRLTSLHGGHTGVCPGCHRSRAGQKRGLREGVEGRTSWLFPDNIFKYTSSLAEHIPVLAAGNRA